MECEYIVVGSIEQRLINQRMAGKVKTSRWLQQMRRQWHRKRKGKGSERIEEG